MIGRGGRLVAPGILGLRFTFSSPQRVFRGTDRTRLPFTYRQGITMFTEEIPWFTSSDREWIMGRGLCEWLGWKLP